MCGTQKVPTGSDRCWFLGSWGPDVCLPFQAEEVSMENFDRFGKRKRQQALMTFCHKGRAAIHAKTQIVHKEKEDRGDDMMAFVREIEMKTVAMETWKD